MTVKELFRILVLWGGLAAAIYLIYQVAWEEPVARTAPAMPSSLDQEDSSEQAEGTDDRIDDCERYINSDQRRACVEARTR